MFLGENDEMDLERVELEWVDHPLWMRPDTTDERCLNEVFEQLAYELMPSCHCDRREIAPRVPTTRSA